MCNLAGYVGKKEASGVLIDMIRRQEAFWGGYYTGIATMHDGKIDSAKLTGDLDKFLEVFGKEKFSGNIGLMHSRSKSGGGDEWAHPFLAYEGDEATLAYVANGGMCAFMSKKAEEEAVADRLHKSGYRLTSRIPTTHNSDYPTLSDKSAVHMSDAMCQNILHHLKNGNTATDAIEKAFCELPAEIVGLAITKEIPNGILWARINMPMFVAFAEHGAYIASTPFAFPDDAGEAILLPANSSGMVYSDRYTEQKFKNPPGSVAEITESVKERAYERILVLLSESEYSFPKLEAELKALFDEATCKPYTPLAYATLFNMNKKGLIKFRTQRVPGVKDGLTAPKIIISLNHT